MPPGPPAPETPSPHPMDPGDPRARREALDAQRRHWESTLSRLPHMFGQGPSAPGRAAAEAFRREGARKILELGAGQGRDSLHFARCGFEVWALDYAASGAEAIARKAEEAGLSGSLTALRHDARDPLPFEDGSFDGCYSHMLFCMALTTSQLESLSREVRRVLKPRGLHIYTVRNTSDAHYGAGVHHGEDLYEMGGFIVHFFSREKVAHLAEGYEVVEVAEFEEGDLPRRLFRVTLRKEGAR